MYNGLPETCNQINSRKGRAQNGYGNKSSKWRWPQKWFSQKAQSVPKSSNWSLEQEKCRERSNYG